MIGFVTDFRNIEFLPQITTIVNSSLIDSWFICHSLILRVASICFDISFDKSRKLTGK